MLRRFRLFVMSLLFITESIIKIFLLVSPIGISFNGMTRVPDWISIQTDSPDRSLSLICAVWSRACLHPNHQLLKSWNRVFSISLELLIKMKIDELILDGFKSYAVRTTIDKWDPQFNAITVPPHPSSANARIRVSTDPGNPISS